MILQTIISGPMKNNTYVLGDSQKPCLVIDPSFEGEKILRYVQKNHGAIEAILLTHGHFDHIASVNLLVETFHCPVYCHPMDSDMCIDAGLNFSTKFRQDIAINERPLSIETWLNPNVDVIHTPGHSMGSVCLYFKDQNWLFSGDTLFAGGEGRTDIPGSNPTELIYSIKKLLLLPDGITLYPGHEEKTTLTKERQRLSAVPKYR